MRGDKKNDSKGTAAINEGIAFRKKTREHRKKKNSTLRRTRSMERNSVAWARRKCNAIAHTNTVVVIVIMIMKNMLKSSEEDAHDSWRRAARASPTILFPVKWFVCVWGRVACTRSFQQTICMSHIEITYKKWVKIGAIAWENRVFDGGISGAARKENR